VDRRLLDNGSTAEMMVNERVGELPIADFGMFPRHDGISIDPC
jgi:hypothetical protein